MEKFPFEAISLSNIINRLKTVRIRRLQILASHVEYECCRELTFAPLAIIVAVHFRVPTEKCIISPGENAVKLSRSAPLHS